jgi:hypothetical protein
MAGALEHESLESDDIGDRVRDTRRVRRLAPKKGRIKLPFSEGTQRARSEKGRLPVKKLTTEHVEGDATDSAESGRHRQAVCDHHQSLKAASASKRPCHRDYGGAGIQEDGTRRRNHGSGDRRNPALRALLLAGTLTY